MTLVSGGRSTLNPNAPLFIPAALRQVEDFSPEWWQLITTSTWYREYWLSQHQGEDGFYNNAEDDFNGNDIADLLPDSFDLVAGEDLSAMDLQFEEFVRSCETEMESRSAPLPSTGEHDETLMENLTTLKSSPKFSVELAKYAEKSPKSSVEPAKYAEKPAKNLNPKCMSQRIQQPR